MELKIIKENMVDGYRITTVKFRDDRYETLIFDCTNYLLDEFYFSCKSLKEAEKGHQKSIIWLKEYLKLIKERGFPPYS